MIHQVNNATQYMERNSTGQISVPHTKDKRSYTSPTSSSQTFWRILLIGEKLRLSFHTCEPVMVKDRRYHFRTYPKCFVGSEAVDWLIKDAAVKDRPLAALMLNILQRHNIIHHVCDDHTFKDTYLFYRFRVDDNTLPLSRDTDLYIKGHKIYHDLTRLGNSSILKLHNELGTKHDMSFYGIQFVNWLVKNNKCATRQDAIGLGKDLLEMDVIRHVTMEHHFRDERTLYIFHPDLHHLRVIDLVEMDERPRSLSLDSSTLPQKQKLLQSPHKLVPPKSPQAFNARPTFHVGTPEIEESLNATLGRKAGISSESDGEDLPSPGGKDGPGAMLFTSTLHRSPTAEELENAEETYVRQTVKMLGDSVGFGFVVRGDGPSYVQTVDPSGPAAKAGLKTGHILYFVNGEYVLRKNHTDVARIILRNTQELTIDVLVPKPYTPGN